MSAVELAGGCEWITPEWPAPAGVRALSTLRTGGVSRAPYAALNLGAHVEDDPTAVAKNRTALKAAADLPEEPGWLKQVHGTHIYNLDLPLPLNRDGPSAGGLGPADGAVTRRPGRVCAILTADCLPVLLTTATGDRVGAAHAGWRGLAGGVLEAAVGALQCPAGELLAWLGPAIGPDHFEVGGEVREAFLGAPGAGDADAAAFVVNDRSATGVDSTGQGTNGRDSAGRETPARGRYLADLYALARCRLGRLGVERVYGGGECTFSAAERYFSHRRDGRTGRQATLIWLEGPPRR